MEIFLCCPIGHRQNTCGHWRNKLWLYLSLNVNNHVWLMTTVMGSSVFILSNTMPTSNRLCDTCLATNSLCSWVLKSWQKERVNFGWLYFSREKEDNKQPPTSITSKTYFSFPLEAPLKVMFTIDRHWGRRQGVCQKSLENHILGNAGSSVACWINIPTYTLFPFSHFVNKISQATKLSRATVMWILTLINISEICIRGVIDMHMVKVRLYFV